MNHYLIIQPIVVSSPVFGVESPKSEYGAARLQNGLFRAQDAVVPLGVFDLGGLVDDTAGVLGVDATGRREDETAVGHGIPVGFEGGCHVRGIVGIA